MKHRGESDSSATSATVRALEVELRRTVRSLRQSPTLAINEAVAGSPEKRLLHMGFGESPFPVHPRIRAALAAAADKNMYLPSAGLPELRTAATRYFAAKLGFDSDGFDSIIGPGSKQLLFALQHAIDGDLLLPVPSWVSYAPQAELLEDQVIPIATTLRDHHHVTGETLDAAIAEARNRGRRPTKLIINYPNNPTGLSLSPSRLEEIADVCRRHNVIVIADEIYALVDHDRSHQSLARYYPEGTVVTTGLSKHLSLGGYRLGVALIPKELRDVTGALVRIASETWSTVAAPIQYASIAAFENHPDIEAYIETCTHIHTHTSRYVWDTVVALGIEYPRPDGAFYLYPDWSRHRETLLKERGVKTSEDLAHDLMERVHLVTLPGVSFGAAPEQLTLRFAVCDFDGQAALNYQEQHPDATPDEFVHGCCPNIVSACEALRSYFGGLT